MVSARVRDLATNCIAPAVWSMLLLSAALSDCRHFSQQDSVRWPPNGTAFSIQLLTSASFACPNATPILDISSDFNLTVNDRSWDFRCAHPTSSLPEFQPRSWGENYSRLHSDFTLVCPPGTVISGVASSYHLTHLDRVWQFLCSGVPRGYTYRETCGWTEETGPRQDFSLSVSDGGRRLGVIAGVASRIFFPALDRFWSYFVCSLQKVDCGTPLLANGNASEGATTFQSSISFSCEPGYYLAGPHTATCTWNGTWTQLPTCTECEPIRHCMETVCEGPEGSLCLRCLPTNPSGLRLVLSQNSRKCRVPPVILSASLHVPFAPGDTLLLPCEAVGNPDPDIRWYKEGHLLGLSERVQRLLNGSLLILNATDSDMGEYDCVAASSVGEDTLNFTLSNTMPPPAVPPRIINWHQILPHVAGDLIWLHCQATGYPPPAITWTGFSVPTPDQPSPRVMQFANGTLAFLPGESKDTGVYTCRAKNTVGDDRQQVVLFVSGISDEASPGEDGYEGEVVAAQIILWRDGYATEVGQGLELECQVTGKWSPIPGQMVEGTPLPTVIWVKSGLEVGAELSREGWGSGGEGGVAVTSTSLIIANASMEDAGNYTCIGWNRGGVTMQVTTVTVVVTPATPTAFSPPSVESAASPTHHYLLGLFTIVLCTLVVCCV